MKNVEDLKYDATHVFDKNKEIQMSKNSLKVSTNNVEEKIYKEIVRVINEK